MKKLMILLLLAMLVASGCGKDTTSNNGKSDSKIAKAVSNKGETSDSEGQKGLTLVKNIDQLGMEPIPNLGDTDYIFEKDGYTYVLTVNSQDVESELFSPEDLAFSLNVSVLKDDKWIVKNKVTDLLNQVWNTKNEKAKTWTSSIEFTNSAMYVLTTTDFAGTGESTEQPIHQIHKITFSNDGVAQDAMILNKRETTEGNFNYGIVNNFEHPYLLEHIYSSSLDDNLDKYNILSEDDKLITTITNSDPNSHSKIELLGNLAFINDGILYFGGMKQAQSYSLKKNDLIWNADGSKFEFPIADGNAQSYSLVKNGVYTVTRIKSDYLLGYTQLDSDGSAREINSALIPSNIDIKQVFVSEDSKNVNVYTIVDYKGKSTIQKYIYSRIDQK
ncbi:hypothetical protein [Neobacillus citreus]|uniref:Lipoprotein n=1 Tax=Neobacillus citreus TaxID=2833578 RepID=A0A942T547_9BACI|nr:hypothetical protein [Neobacillus citreus]MCH6269647.1 hypothetical protein [Neobacillus citreus]